MKQFNTFGEYMFDLLFAPLKKGKRTVNQFYILFKVVGRVFDGLKEDALRVRDETNVVSASPVMLPVHGQDRDMPRLEGETIDAYRTRLAMKGIISEWSGVNRGILYTLAALGYEQSRIEPVYEWDPEHWAEFIVFLKGSKQSGVYNLDVIDTEVRKVKEGSSRPFYGTEAGNDIVFLSRLHRGLSDYPRCGQLLCGVWPHVASIGYLLKSVVEIGSRTEPGDVRIPRCGEIAASEEFYHYGEYTLYRGLGSELVAVSRQEHGVKVYLRCAETTRCSPTNDVKGGVGSILAAAINPGGRVEPGEVTFPKLGTFTASTGFYCFSENIVYEELVSELVAVPRQERGVKVYLRCAEPTRCSPTNDVKGGVGGTLGADINPGGRVEPGEITFPRTGSFVASTGFYSRSKRKS